MSGGWAGNGNWSRVSDGLFFGRLDAEFDAVACGLGDNAAVTLAPATPQLGLWRKLRRHGNNEADGD
jgi:hypothetical protein